MLMQSAETGINVVGIDARKTREKNPRTVYFMVGGAKK